MNAKKSGSSAGYGLGRVEPRHNDLIAAKERKEVKISADYTDYADFGFGPSRAATQKGADFLILRLWIFDPRRKKNQPFRGLADCVRPVWELNTFQRNPYIADTRIRPAITCTPTSASNRNLRNLRNLWIFYFCYLWIQFICVDPRSSAVRFTAD